MDEQVSWPGVAALLPVSGTVLLIAAGPHAVINSRLLSSAVARWIGTRSYALYLWHWPPLAFLHLLAAERGMSAAEVTTWSVGCGLAAVALAHLTCVFIERPLRTRSERLERTAPIGWRHLRPYGIGLAGIAAAGLAVLLVRGWPQRYGADGVDVVATLKAGSPDSIAAYEREATKCQLADRGVATWCRRVGRTGPGLALIGDSHAEVLFAGLHALDPSRRMLLSGRKGCAPILQSDPIDDPTAEVCRRSAALAHQAIRDDHTMHTVIIASRGPAYLSGTGFGVDSLRRVVPVALGDSLPMRQAFEDGLVRSIEGYRAAGKQVILVLGIPELGFLPEECLIGRPFELRRIRTPCGVRRDAFTARNAAYRDLVGRVQMRVPALRVFDPTQIFCDGTVCRAMERSHLLYSDGNHLTLAGSRLVATALIPWLAQQHNAASLVVRR